MTTDVSMRPRSCLGTGGRILIDVRVDICAESLVVDRRRAAEGGDGGGRRRKMTGAQRSERADWNSVAGDDKRFAALEASHDLAAVIAEFALTDFPG